MALEHRAAQFHDIEPGDSHQRLALVDVGDHGVAELSGALGERTQHFGERQHAGELAVVHDDQRADVVLRHDLDCLEHRAARASS